jgi:HK97 family phage prohead protease
MRMTDMEQVDKESPKAPESVTDIDQWRNDAIGGKASTSVVLRKQFSGEVEVGDDRRVKFVITTGEADRENDVIDPAGWDVSSYLKNPVVMFAHDYSALPVARTVSLESEGDKLVAVAEFASKELNPMAEQVFQMLKEGFLKGASVGFRPKTFQYNEKRGGVDFVQQELLEFSVVPIPANAQALMAAGLASADINVLKSWAENVILVANSVEHKQPISDQLDDFLDVIRKMMNDIKVSVRETIRNVDEFQNTFQYSSPSRSKTESEVQELVFHQKGVSPTNVSTTTAPMETPWRRPSLGDFSNSPWEELTTSKKRRIAGHFAWATARVPDTFGDMKLPHHRADDGYVVWRGVVAAAGRLDQTSLPSEDVPAVKKHLANHFKEFDREAPWLRDEIEWNAFLKARDRAYRKYGTLSDIAIAKLFDDYGFIDEAATLMCSIKDDEPLSNPSPPDESVGTFMDVLSERLDRIEELLSPESPTESKEPPLIIDEMVLEVSEDTSKDVGTFDEEKLSSVINDALRESINSVVLSETRTAINAMRGRIG